MCVVYPLLFLCALGFLCGFITQSSRRLEQNVSLFRWLTPRLRSDALAASLCSRMCTPGMGVNLWGESPLYVNPVYVNNYVHKRKY